MKNLKAVLPTFLICLLTVNICYADASIGEAVDLFYTIIFILLNLIAFIFLIISQSKNNKRKSFGTRLFLFFIILGLLLNGLYSLQDTLEYINLTLLSFVVQLLIFLLQPGILSGLKDKFYDKIKDNVED